MTATDAAGSSAPVVINPLQAEVDRLNIKVVEIEHFLRAAKSFDREFLMVRGSMGQRAAYADLARRIKAPLLQQRSELGRAYCEQHSDDAAPEAAGLDLRAADAFATLDLTNRPKVIAAVDEARKIFDETGGLEAERVGKGSLEYVISAGKSGYGQDSAAYALATSPDLLVPITRYFGALPILTGYSISLARNNEFHRKSSQRLHFDPEDRTQVKVFVYITDVDEDSGPFMSAGAAASEPLFTDQRLILDRMDDTVVAPGAIRTATGPAGTVSFCDTCRCLHGGARPGGRPRLMLSIEYNLPTYLWAPLYEGDGEMRNRMAGVTLKPSSAFESALLGESLVYGPLESWTEPT
ncbi:hypothetical protein ACWCOP_13710 [Maricaulaceae bacterium MS644]